MLRPLFALVAVALVAAVAFVRAPGAEAQQGIDWKGCNDGFQCGTLTVPMDYADPGGKTVSLALIRLPASDSGERIGSLVTDPGGPGGSGIDFVRAWARSLSGDIRSRFDIVGWDPRGVGQSTPIVCHKDLQALVATDPTPDDQQEWDALQDINRDFADGCASYGDYLEHVGTRDVARDLDRIRAALGDAKLTYVGFSYGTVIGQVYADLFPANIRAMVLDGAVDLSLATDEQSLTQAIGFERALNQYIAACRADSCDLTNVGDPAQVIDALIAKAEAAPIPAPGADRPAGPGETFTAIAAALYTTARWDSLTRAILDGLDGDGTRLVRLTDDYLERRGNNGDYANITEANLAVNCLDRQPSQLPDAFKDYPATVARFRSVAPRVGAYFAGPTPCDDWPAAPEPLTVPKAAGSPPILVVDTTQDPATPYEWGLAVSKQLPNATLLTHGGQGHGAYSFGDSCVDGAVNGYLIGLAMPAAGTFCGDANLPAPQPGSGSGPGPTTNPGSGSGSAQTPAPPGDTSGPPRATADSGDDFPLFTAIAAAALFGGFVLVTLIVITRLRRGDTHR